MKNVICWRFYTERRGSKMWIAECAGGSEFMEFATKAAALKYADRMGGKWFIYKIEMEGLR